MDYRDTPEEAEFRASLRAWLKKNVPSDWHSQEESKVYRDWHRRLFDAGYVGMSWPVEYGGQDKSPVYDAILNEEAGNADSPPIPSVGYLGRAIFTYGTDEQKKRFLPTLLSGEVRWCQGFSEPNAGSDLAALRTRAVLDGDTYTVNGQKMWTSGAQYSDWCVLLVRTNTEVPKHKGITCLLTSLDVPGVEVRPIVLADRDPETSEVFWDNVHVPADQRLGNEGDGWRIAMTTVSYERGPADVGIIANYRRALKEAETLAADRGLINDPEIRRQLALGYVEGEVLRLNVAEQLSARVSGKLPGPEGSISKQLWTWAEQHLQHAALDMAGADAVNGYMDERLNRYFRSRPVSVYGGSQQIQNNLIAQHMLGMPRA
jgi:alkylation response protein AidB-like acyl-CoA dehydrogenase